MESKAKQKNKIYNMLPSLRDNGLVMVMSILITPMSLRNQLFVKQDGVLVFITIAVFMCMSVNLFIYLITDSAKFLKSHINHQLTSKINY